MAETPDQPNIVLEALRRGLSPSADPTRPDEGGSSGPDFRAAFETLPIALYVTDAAGHITFFNGAAAVFWGRRPEIGKTEWCGSWKLFWADGRPMPHETSPMAVALKEQRPVYGTEVVVERPDGTRVPFLPYPTPLFDKAGGLVGGFNLMIEASDRQRAEDYGQRLASIIEFSDDAILSKDLNGVIATWNRGAERLFGYKAHEIIGRPVTVLMPEERINEEPGILDRIRRGERIEHYETIRRRKDGSLVDISLSVSPVRNSEGRIVGASKIARDITDRKRAEEKQAIVFGEMRHRVKNSLAMAQVLAMQTLRGATAEEQSTFVGRLGSLSAAQDVLTARTWNQAPFRDVVVRGLAAFEKTYDGRIVIDGPDDVSLAADRVLSLTLVLHELATNAVKYGALSTAEGTVTVRWDLIDEAGQDRVRFEWREAGGPAVVPPAETGFGSRLIARSFGDTAIAFLSDGLVCRFEMDAAPPAIAS